MNPTEGAKLTKGWLKRSIEAAQQAIDRNPAYYAAMARNLGMDALASKITGRTDE